MGPFKHTVDDGLDIRKAAFECMYTLLDSCLDRLDIFEFLNHVEDGLKDHYDIKVGHYFSCAQAMNLLYLDSFLQYESQIMEKTENECHIKAFVAFYRKINCIEFITWNINMDINRIFTFILA